MKKLNHWVVLALGVGALVVAFLLSGAPVVGAAPQPPAPTSVLVTNDPSAPVPVKGAVGILGMPTVRLAPAIPLQGFEGDGVVDVDFAQVKFARTQPTKLEHVTAWIQLPAGQKLTEVYLFGFGQGEQVKFWLTPIRIADSAARSSVTDIYQVSQALPAYFDGDFSLFVERDDPAGALSVFASFVATSL